MPVKCIRLVMIAALGLFVVSCAPTSNTSLVGKWLTPTGASIDFKPDGSATMAGPRGAQEVRYRLVDGHTIEIRRPGGTSFIRWEIVSLGARELIIKDADGKEVKMHRAE